MGQIRKKITVVVMFFLIFSYMWTCLAKENISSIHLGYFYTWKNVAIQTKRKAGDLNTVQVQNEGLDSVVVRTRAKKINGRWGETNKVCTITQAKKIYVLRCSYNFGAGVQMQLLAHSWHWELKDHILSFLFDVDV